MDRSIDLAVQHKRCYFCLSQLPKTKKESTANTFFGQRGRGGHKEPAELTILPNIVKGNNEQYILPNHVNVVIMIMKRLNGGDIN